MLTGIEAEKSCSSKSYIVVSLLQELDFLVVQPVKVSCVRIAGDHAV